MAKQLTRYAEPAPREPREHADFERFIRDLDSGRMPLCRPKNKETADAD